MKAYLFHCRSCERFHIYYTKTPSKCDLCGGDKSLMDEMENISIQISLTELAVGSCPGDCPVRGTMWCNPSCRHWEQEHRAD